MPRFQTYDAKERPLRPAADAYAAFETAGRRIGALYNEAGTAERRIGQLDDQAIRGEGFPLQFLAFSKQTAPRGRGGFKVTGLNPRGGSSYGGQQSAYNPVRAAANLAGDWAGATPSTGGKLYDAGTGAVIGDDPNVTVIRGDRTTGGTGTPPIVTDKSGDMTTQPGSGAMDQFQQQNSGYLPGAISTEALPPPDGYTAAPAPVPAAQSDSGGGFFSGLLQEVQGAVGSVGAAAASLVGASPAADSGGYDATGGVSP